jgi:hypothetical protein
VSHVRRSLVLIVALCVALAVGIALGGGPLQGDSEDAPDWAAENEQLAGQVAELEAARVFDEAFGEAVGPDLVAGRLKGRTYTLLLLPGTPPDTVDMVRTTLEESGATLVLTAKLQAGLVDPAQRTYVDSVATNSVKGQPELARLARGETYDRVGALLARAYVGTGDDTAVDEPATAIDSELQGARLVEVEGDPGRRGSLAVVLGPMDEGSDESVAAQQVIEVALVNAVAKGSDGLLVMKPDSGTTDPLSSSLAAQDSLGGDASWSSLNVVEGSSAGVAAVYALAAAANGEGGVFGLTDGSVALPPGLGPRTAGPTD